jgi:hypothetical protein
MISHHYLSISQGTLASLLMLAINVDINYLMGLANEKSTLHYLVLQLQPVSHQ